MKDEHQHIAGRGWKRQGWIALPVAHMLALAPLDVWIRMLRRSGGVAPRYWVRLGFVLFTSFVGTICTVHERLLVLLWGSSPIGRARIDAHRPEVVVILGYYRSGTTHLHNLMSCDRRFVTPRWFQCLAGQGYVIGWAVVRFLLVPFLGRTRPQDGVGFGPEWPGEDDFALAGWGGCSSLAGRYVFPGAWDDWKRWHDLEGLDERELSRWRRLTRWFVYKVARGRADRLVLLKTPSHTARVDELDRLFEGRVRYVHLVREPGAVIDSNIRMMHALRGHLLHACPSVDEIRRRVGEEYFQSERRCRESLERVDEDRWVRVRFKDLRADPMGSLRGIYEGLGIGFDEPTQHGVQGYLGSLGGYRSSGGTVELGDSSEPERVGSEELTRLYGLAEPARAGGVVEYTPRADARVRRGAIGALGMMMVCWGSWVLLVAGQHAIRETIRPRMVVLVWVFGALIGLVARKSSGGRGTEGLGVWCAILTLAMVITVLFPVSVINWNWAHDDGMAMWLKHNWLNVQQGLTSVSSLVLVVLGMLTAYRHGSSDGAIVPGR